MWHPAVEFAVLAMEMLPLLTQQENICAIYESYLNNVNDDIEMGSIGGRTRGQGMKEEGRGSLMNDCNENLR